MGEWVTVKEYADTHGITIQAVYQQLKRKKNKPFIDAHSKLIRGTKYLDQDAVEYLENQRDNSPTIVVQENNSEEFEALRRENELLKNQLLELQNKHIKYRDEMDAKQHLIAQAEAQARLLEDKEKQLERVENELEEKERQFDQERKRAERAEQELSQFKPSWFGLYRKEK